MRKNGTGYFFSNFAELSCYVHNDILQVGLMNQAPAVLKKVACPIFHKGRIYDGT